VAVQHGAAGPPAALHPRPFDVTYDGGFDGAGGGGLKNYFGDVDGDDDYNMNLVTPGGDGTAFGNDPADSVHLEFDSDETIDNFQNDLWWNNLHAVVDNGDSNLMNQMVNGHDAVVVGLMGIDAVHAPRHTEIHPVHVLAVREAAPGAVDPASDSWAIFARNWGNEGECGSQQHYLDTNHITVDIPRPSNVPAGATASVTDPNSFWGHNTSSPPIVHNDAAGVQITFNLPNGDAQAFVYGELHLNWSGQKAQAAQAQPKVLDTAVAAGGMPAPTESLDPGDPGDPEDMLAQVWNAMTPAQQATANAFYVRFAPPKPQIDETQLSAQVSDVAPPFPASQPTVSSAADPIAMETLKAQFQSLCSATGGNLPTQPDWCSSLSLPPVTTLTTSGGVQGPNGWLTTPVTATLTAYDAAASGINHTEYSYDGQTWTTYSGPFILPDGVYTLWYRSADNNGDLEQANQHSFKIDTRPPVITVNQPTATAYTHSSALSLNYSADDGPATGLNAGSGVASVAARLDGAATLAGHGLGSGQAIKLLTELHVGTHTFTVDATDNVGHEDAVSVTFTIIVTPESIKEDVAQFAAAGAFKNSGIQRSLLAKLDEAGTAYNAGQCTTASNVYGAFVNELRAQAGKGVDTKAAQIMTEDAQYLISHCPAP
jgi:hypothetical protein